MRDRSIDFIGASVNLKHVHAIRCKRKYVYRVTVKLNPSGIERTKKSVDIKIYKIPILSLIIETVGF